MRFPTWRISAQAEILDRPPGWNFVSITWQISARVQCLKLGWKICRKAFYMLFLCTPKAGAHAHVHISARAEICSAITWGFSARLTGLKFPARFVKPGWKFQPGLKLSSCNRKRLFKKICSGSRAENLSPANRPEISAQAEIFHVIGPSNPPVGERSLKFVPGGCDREVQIPILVNILIFI